MAVVGGRGSACTLALAAVAVLAATGSVAAAPGGAASPQARPSYCPAPSRVLHGVYHPSRLQVLAPCLRAAGVVQSVRHEEDGDLHIGLQVTPAFRRLLNDVNTSRQHGWLVVEFMARDGGHLPRPAKGDRITVVGAWVLDEEHGWNEIHPVWRLILHGSVYTSGPKFGGSPAGDRSGDAAEDCRDGRGRVCAAYTSPPAKRTTQAPSSTASRASGAPAGATAECADGTYSFSQHRRGTCSHHGGVAVWLRSVPP